MALLANVEHSVRGRDAKFQMPQTQARSSSSVTMYIAYETDRAGDSKFALLQVRRRKPPVNAA